MCDMSRLLIDRPVPLSPLRGWVFGGIRRFTGRQPQDEGPVSFGKERDFHGMLCIDNLADPQEEGELK